MSADEHPHDFTLTGPNGSVRFSILAMGIYLTPAGGEADCMVTRYTEALRDEWHASGEDAACVWARLGELYATLPKHGPSTEAPVVSPDGNSMNCPNCGSECSRDQVDVGVGVIYGPWGCYCGWSESCEYNQLRDGYQPLAESGYVKDQWGGLTPPA